MSRNLGAFTCYGIEYVFDFLGDKKIAQKIEDLKVNLTGSLGVSLQDFTYRSPEFSYFSGKGILWVFDLMMQWFDDIEFAVFLYEKSKQYTESNYYNEGYLSRKWQEYLLVCKSSSAEDKKKASYWIDFHFFHMHLSKIITQAFKEKKDIEVDLVGSYTLIKNKLLGIKTLEVKTRRKPLTGQYLMDRERTVWYNLELTNSNEIQSTYQFFKNESLYNLHIEKETATIELKEQNAHAASFVKKIQEINLETIWSEVIEFYIYSFPKISAAFKESDLFNSNTQISNGIMWNIHDYYEEQGHELKAKDIARLNNKFREVWREMPEEYEED
jgi:hypothetical protein